MNSSSKLLRWLKVLLMGCALGLLVVLAIASVWTFSGSARRAAPFKLSQDLTKQKLVQVIGSQLSAFRGGDYAVAYEFAASGLKSQMSREAFEQMVREGYPAFMRSRDVGFGLILDNGELAVVNMAIGSGTGGVLHYQYLLRREKTGWKISGVTRVKPTGTTI